MWSAHRHHSPTIRHPLRSVPIDEAARCAWVIPNGRLSDDDYRASRGRADPQGGRDLKKPKARRMTRRRMRDAGPYPMVGGVHARIGLRRRPEDRAEEFWRSAQRELCNEDKSSPERTHHDALWHNRASLQRSQHLPVVFFRLSQQITTFGTQQSQVLTIIARHSPRACAREELGTSLPVREPENSPGWSARHSSAPDGRSASRSCGCRHGQAGPQ